jgi:hypothetical protein
MTSSSTGKTTLFEQLTGAGPNTAAPEPGHWGTLWVTGSELSDSAAFESIIGEYLAALPVVVEVDAPPGFLTVALDQLDGSADLGATGQG